MTLQKRWRSGRGVELLSAVLLVSGAFAACSESGSDGAAGAGGEGGASGAPSAGRPSAGAGAGSPQAGSTGQVVAGAGGTDGGANSAGGASSCAVDCGGAPADGGAGAGGVGAGAGGEAGGSAIGGAGGEGGSVGCTAEQLSAVPVGTYTLQLDNKVENCLVDTFECTTTSQVSGTATLELTAGYNTAENGDIYLNGLLVAPGLDLDGRGTHEDFVVGYIVYGSDSGGWNPASGAQTISLEGQICFTEGGEVGQTEMQLEVASGKITNFSRICRTRYATVYSQVTTQGSGTLSCE